MDLYTPKILIVDDEESNQAQLHGILSVLDAEIVMTNSGKHALDLIKDHQFALFIIDIQMPSMDGYELARQLNKDINNELVPIIFLSDHINSDVEQIRAYEYGAMDYLEKPVVPGILLPKINIVLQLWQEKKRVLFSQTLLADYKELIYEHLLVSITNTSGMITNANKEFCHLSGYRVDELIGKNHRIFNSNHHSKNYWKKMYAMLLDGKVWHGEILNKSKDGNLVWLDTTIMSIFNDMGEITSYIAVRTDITERKITSDQLKKYSGMLEEIVTERTVELENAKNDAVMAQTKAEEANRAKTSFLANMSHELRTPMHGILSYSKMGISRIDKADAKKNLKYFTNIHSSASRLMGQLKNIMDIADLESGSTELEYCSANLAELALASVAKLKTFLEDNQQEIEFDSNNVIAQGSFDQELIGKVIDNFLSNAMKYSPIHSQIQLEIQSGDFILKDKKMLCLKFSVKDQGPGVVPGEETIIFEKFVQGSDTTIGTTKGTGLGLPISKEIIDLHHGKIWAENHEEGGALLSFIIPAVKIEIDGVGDLDASETKAEKQQASELNASFNEELF